MGEAHLKRKPAFQLNSSAVGQELLVALVDSDINPSPVLGKIDCTLPVSELRNNASAWSGVDLQAFMREAILSLEIRASTRCGRQPMQLWETLLMSSSVISCGTLGEAIERCTDFCLMLGGRCGSLKLNIYDGSASLIMQTERNILDICSYIPDLTGLMTFHRLFSWLIGHEIPLSSINVRHHDLKVKNLERMFFKNSITHNSYDNRITFPRSLINLSVIRRSEEMPTFLQGFPYTPIKSPCYGIVISEQVRAVIMHELTRACRIPSINEICRQLITSEATLRRKLSQAGTTVRQIGLDCRMEIAKRLLTLTAMPVHIIASNTGYTDPASFNRAFLRSVGMTPHRYRNMVSSGLSGKHAKIKI